MRDAVAYRWPQRWTSLQRAAGPSHERHSWTTLPTKLTLPYPVLPFMATAGASTYQPRHSPSSVIRTISKGCSAPWVCAEHRSYRRRLSRSNRNACAGVRGIDQGAGSTTAATGQSRIGLLHAATRKVRSATRGRGPAYRCWARRENPARVQAAGAVHVTRIVGRHRRQSPFREKAEHFHAGQRVWECSAFRRRPGAGFGGSISGRWRYPGLL